MSVLHGKIIGDRYRLLEPLGRGGMAVVWRAEDVLLGREVAVKVLSAEVAAMPTVLQRMYAEARAAASLRHDNVVEVYDYGQTDIDGIPLPYVVMALVDGRPLNDLLSAGALPWRVAVLIGAQVAAALAAAHDRGLVHRDVKPANVMVAAGGIKLVDFGISAAVGELEAASDEIVGTPAYLAPERMAGGMVRPATDVYALGLLLYRMLAGRMPWNASTTTQMLRAHRYRQPAPLPAVDQLPAEVTELVHGCLAKAPSDRPAAVTVARALRTAAGLPPLPSLTEPDARLDRDGARTESITASSVTGDATTSTAAVDSRPDAMGTRAGLALRRRPRLVGAALLVAAVATGVVVWPTKAPHQPAAAAAADPLTCRVTYRTQLVEAGETTTAISLANTGPATLDAWTLAFRLPGDQRLVKGSHATWSTSGETVLASGDALNSGAETELSFTTAFQDSMVLPRSFAVNDVVCDAEMSVRGTETTSAQPVRTVSAIEKTTAGTGVKRPGGRAKKPGPSAKKPKPAPKPAGASGKHPPAPPGRPGK